MRQIGYMPILYWFMYFLVWKTVVTMECSTDVHDEYWPFQWYLNKTSNKYDMNVLPAWKLCINGTGIRVAVVDTGVQDHSDLLINRQMGFGNSSKGVPHGTRVAGIIAARKNEKFTVGVAFGAEIVDVLISPKTLFDSFDPAVLSHKSEDIDVYSCSFANFHSGSEIFPLSEEQEQAFKIGTSKGRKGKGSVYVFSTGNMGDIEDLTRDSCAYDRLITNPYVISVAGIQHDMTKVKNGESCSAMMLAAFTANPGAKDYNVITLDMGNTITTYFADNSAAVPMVSGAVALALNANPRLTYRDVMHLIARTSRNRTYVPEFKRPDIGFFTNAAGFEVSSLFGFGLLDIGELVAKSVSWENVPKKKEYSISLERVEGEIVEIRDYKVTVTSNCSISYLEHVEVCLSINAAGIGHMQLDLISPYGTTSTIIPGRSSDNANDLNITVVTVQMWGENPVGMWRLAVVQPSIKKSVYGVLHKFELIFHGFTCAGNERFRCLPAYGVYSPAATTSDVHSDDYMSKIARIVLTMAIIIIVADTSSFI